MKKIIYWFKPAWAKLLALIIVLAIGYLVYQNNSSTQQASPQYQISTAERSTLVVSVSGSGSVSAANNTNVSTALGGVIESVYVADGQLVKAGAPILKLALDDDSKQKQAQAYASYLNAVDGNMQSSISKASVQTDLEKARQTVLNAAQQVAELDEDLATDSINPTTKEKYTQNEIDSIRSTLTQARSNFAIAEQKYTTIGTSIAASRASLSAAQIEYQNYSDVVTAPVDGVITNFTLQQGDRIVVASNSESSTNTTNTVAVIKTENKPTVTIGISEIDIPSVQIGNRVTITADAFPEATYTGKVTAIDTVGSSNSGVVSYPVTVVLDVEQDQLFANMTVSAHIITSTKADVLLVPSSALVKQDTASYVRVLNNGNIEMKEVVVGDSSDTQTEIVSGVNTGEQVVTSVINQTQGTTMNSSGRSVFSTGGFGGGGAVRIMR